MLLTRNLTKSPIDKLAANTVCGMAYFAGTGPKNKTCGDCSHFHRDRCGKFIELMLAARRPATAPPIRGGLRACKYFAPRTRG